MSVIREIWGLITTPSNWKLEHVLAFFQFIPVILGGLFALQNYLASNRVKRAGFIKPLIDSLESDPDMLEIFGKIDYGYFEYGNHFSENPEDENKTDKLLRHLSYICYLKSIKVIKENEFRVFAYTIERTCLNPNLQAYLWNLYHFANKRVKSRNKEKMQKLLKKYKDCFVEYETPILKRAICGVKRSIIKCMIRILHYKSKHKDCSFQFLIEYGLKKGLIDIEFLNENSKRFGRKHLNF